MNNRKRKVYVASSWRNDLQQKVVGILRSEGHEVYDFKNPSPGDRGFHWYEIDPLWKGWSVQDFVKALKHPLAQAGFKKDYSAMFWADCCVMVMPCGRSAHIEAGYFIGVRKTVIILAMQDVEPELMYLLASKVCTTMPDVLTTLQKM